MNALTIQVPFHGNNLFIVEHNSEPYTPMKPIVEGMGLTWQPQLAKLNANANRWGITKIVIPTLGDLQEMVCLPLRKIFGWLMTISPNKVKPEIKPLIEMYQDECDEVLWQYWNNKLKTSADDRTPLRQACDRLAVGNMLVSDAYKVVTERYKVEHIDQIPMDKLPEAVAFVYEMILRLKPTQPTDTEYTKNMFSLGRAKADESREILDIIDKALTDLDYSVQKLKKNNATHYSIFESLKIEALSTR